MDTEIKKDTFSIRDQFTLDRTKPDIEEILQCDTVISQKEMKAVKGGVNIKAEAVISVLYTGTGKKRLWKSANFTCQSTGTVEIPEAAEGMIPFGSITVEKTEGFVVPNSEGEEQDRRYRSCYTGVMRSQRIGECEI